MVEVPRIVRERLPSQATPGEHPDANLLSAFAEHLLAERERASVLDHLSHCAECREVMALLVPGEVKEGRPLTAAAPSAAGERRSWWRSPVLHWGALTATALVVLIAVGARMRLREGHSASAPAIAKSEVAEKPAISASEPGQAIAKPKDSRKPAETATNPRHPATINAPRAAGAVGGPVTIVANHAAAAPSPPLTVIEKPLQQRDQLGPAAGPLLEKQRKIEQAEVKMVPAPSAAKTDSVEVTAAAPTTKPEGALLYRSQSARTFARQDTSRTARWSIANSGALQRSLDGGRSWKEVAVADGISFRAVATVDQDVWAGGTDGALFHSEDGGEHWSRVQVQANGRVLSGVILRVEFADVRNGAVTTSTGETWATSDAGATWHQQ